MNLSILGTINYHVVENRVYSSELSQEDHNVGVNDSSSGAWLGEKVHPWEAIRATSSNLSFLFFCANLHNKKFLSGFVGGDTADAPPDFVRLEGLTLVYTNNVSFLPH
jgi:hypothetical protein